VSEQATTQSIFTVRFSISAGFVSARVTIRRRDLHVSSGFQQTDYASGQTGHLPYAYLFELLFQEPQNYEIFRSKYQNMIINRLDVSK